MQCCQMFHLVCKLEVPLTIFVEENKSVYVQTLYSHNKRVTGNTFQLYLTVQCCNIRLSVAIYMENIKRCIKDFRLKVVVLSHYHQSSCMYMYMLIHCRCMLLFSVLSPYSLIDVLHKFSQNWHFTVHKNIDLLVPQSLICKEPFCFCADY